MTNPLQLPLDSKPRHVAFLVQGLFEISDSIGFDCVYQYHEVKASLCDNGGFGSVSLFAERFVQERYPTVTISDLPAFYEWSRKHPDGIVIYHYCGEWREIDQHLINRQAPSIIRWHNNTPPWFYMEGGISNKLHTIAGFDNIVELIQHPQIFFWVNSEFTSRQFFALGGKADRLSVVYPASRYLYKDFSARTATETRSFGEDGFNLLFVGRIVRHKGYKGLIAAAKRLKVVSSRDVRLHLPGRIDSMYLPELEEYASTLGVDTIFHGEVSEAKLIDLYRSADVFLCFSEHEGFGLPVFEAMACGIPVVAWATTAFADLLDAHPLAFREYDLNLFVAAIIALGDDTLRTHVLEIQKRICLNYNADVVKAQLVDGIGMLALENQTRAIVSTLPQSLQHNPELARRIAERAIASRTGGQSNTVLRDSGHNLYSLYDLKIYDDFLAIHTAKRNVLLQPALSDPHVLFLAEEFSWRRGEMANERLIVDFDSTETSHLVFGPYVQFPSGRFDAQFQLDINTTHPFSIVIDVAVGGRTIAETTHTHAKQSINSSPRLQFTLDSEGEIVEFRIRPKGGSSGRIEFSGVTVRQTL